MSMPMSTILRYTVPDGDNVLQVWLTNNKQKFGSIVLFASMAHSMLWLLRWVVYTSGNGGDRDQSENMWRAGKRMLAAHCCSPLGDPRRNDWKGIAHWAQDVNFCGYSRKTTLNHLYPNHEKAFQLSLSFLSSSFNKFVVVSIQQKICIIIWCKFDNQFNKVYLLYKYN